MSIILRKNDVGLLESIVTEEILDAGADHVVIIDMSGNLVIERGKLEMNDILALAVLSAANFAATAEIARLIGEEDFTLLFHKGDKKNIHFSRLGRNHIIMILFEDSVSLGLIRLKANSVQEKLSSLFNWLEG